MEDFPELSVDSIQEAVRPGRPLSVYGWHGRHAALQAQEVFLYLDTHRQENQLWFLNIMLNFKIKNEKSNLQFAGW